MRELALSLFGEKDAYPYGVPPLSRSDFVRRKCAFTTDEGKHHLVTLAEYVAMYLIALNSLLRGASIDVGGVALRRLMANVATYMVFDDHEVTDDWNLDANWRERVSPSDAALGIQTSALTASRVKLRLNVSTCLPF